MSGVPPGGKVTITRTGLDGKPWAHVADERAASTASATIVLNDISKTPRTTARRISPVHHPVAPPRPLRGHPSLRKEGKEKKKAARLLLFGSASEHQAPRVFLVLRLLPYFLWRSLRMAASCAAREDSSASTVAISCLSFAWRRASSAAFRASVALASSKSRPRTAVSASTVTTSGCTSRIPPATKTSSSSPPPAGLILTDPGLMRVMSGVCLG